MTFFMRSWRTAKSGKLVPYYHFKSYKKSRWKKLELRAARYLKKLEPWQYIPGFNKEVTKQTGEW